MKSRTYIQSRVLSADPFSAGRASSDNDSTDRLLADCTLHIICIADFGGAVPD